MSLGSIKLVLFLFVLSVATPSAHALSYGVVETVQCSSGYGGGVTRIVPPGKTLIILKARTANGSYYGEFVKAGTSAAYYTPSGATKFHILGTVSPDGQGYAIHVGTTTTNIAAEQQATAPTNWKALYTIATVDYGGPQVYQSSGLQAVLRCSDGYINNGEYAYAYGSGFAGTTELFGYEE